jgi:CRISPR-associated protein Csb2
MAQHLVLTVRLYEDGFGTARYHGMSQGAPEWPPAPARVYQALVAGSAIGNALPEQLVPAFEWLESLQPPIIAAPTRTLGQRISLFVPNNDADSLPDPRDVSGIRTAKLIQPSLFAADQPLLYAWELGSDDAHARAIVEAAHGIYQLGRGIDMAWAAGQVIGDNTFEDLLSTYRGVVHRPHPGSRGDRALACPLPGSLRSLVERHGAKKLQIEEASKRSRVLFTNSPKPRFASISYAHSRSLVVYELRDRSQARPWPWALGRATALVEKLRDTAAARLRAGLGDDGEQVTRSLVGRAEDGSGTVPIAQRVHIVPLPSIGSVHADRAIRRVVVEVPSGSPLRAADVEWAFSGLDWADAETGELSPLVVTKSDTDDMLTHYIGPSRRWRSVTAVALPENVRRRRIDPVRRQPEAKSAQERISEEARAVTAVHVALRQAGLQGTATAVRVQREPFEAKGLRAEAFAPGTRFAKERLWHVEIELDRLLEGPLSIGDGRFIGLGVMAPVAEAWRTPTAQSPQRHAVQLPSAGNGLFALEVAGPTNSGSDAPIQVARALRRAVMARVRDTLGLRPDAGLDRFFSGHELDGTGSKAHTSRHLAFQWDRPRQRLLVIAPHLIERRVPGWHERQHLLTLERALDGFFELRAGTAGHFRMRPCPLSPSDTLLVAATRWTSLTPYAVTRHRKCSSANEALVADVLAECARCSLPRPEVEVTDVRGVSGRGLEGHVQLRFAVAVAGPIVLGRTSHLGGGLFVAQNGT